MTHPSANHEIVHRLPHRDPFLFVSAMVEIEPGCRAVALWRVTGREAFFQGHFPGHPIVPGVLVGEALAQVSGLVAFGAEGHVEASLTSPLASPVAARLARIDLKFPAAIVPPAEVRLESVLVRRLESVVMFDVRATVGTETAAVGSLVLGLPSGVFTDATIAEETR